MTEGYVSNALRGDQSYGNLATLDNYHGGGLYNNSKANPSIEDYENIFGPAARDIKEDSDRHRRRQRWHLPDALKGPNPWLADRIDGLITDTTNSPFTTYLLPYKHIDNVDGKIQWNVWSFDEGMASRVPYESSARVLTQTKRSFAGYTVRQGLAIVMEANFMMSEAGQKNFKDQLSQVVHSIQYSNNFDVTMALIQAPSYEKHFEEKYPADHNKPPLQKIRDYVDMFGYMQKNPNALDICIEDCKTTLRSWGSKEPDFLLCNSKLTMQLQMHPERTQYFTQGDDGVRRLREGPNINKYRGLKIINTHSFSTETGVRPRDLLARRVRVGEYYRFVPPKGRSIFDCVGSLYNEERDTWDTIDFQSQYKKCEKEEERKPYEDEKVTVNPKKTSKKLYDFLKALGHTTMTRTFTELFTPTIAFAAGRMGIFFERYYSAKRAGTAMDDATVNAYGMQNIAHCLMRSIIFNRNTVTNLLDFSSSYDRSERIAVIFHELEQLVNKTVTEILEKNYDEPTNESENQRLLHEAIARINMRIPNDFKIDVAHLDVNNLPCDDKHFIALIQKLGLSVPMEPATDLKALNWYFQWITLSNWFRVLVLEFVGNQNMFDNFASFEQNVRLIQDSDREQMKIEAIIRDIPFKYQPHEILLLRPNIEHQMFGIILGKSGMDDLGATLWGQTQLECYSDSVHGIWGMSYKYNERAIVFNEKNLVRVWDIAYAAYCGGKGTKILESGDNNDFISKTLDNSKPYDGADIIFIPINMLLNEDKQNYPSPARFYTNEEHCDANADSILPESNFNIRNIENVCFKLGDNFKWVEECLEHVSSQTNLNKSLQENAAENTTSCTGGVYFEGSYRLQTKEGVVYNETRGSGHHGPDFVGAASKRNGKGMNTSFANNTMGIFAAT